MSEGTIVVGMSGGVDSSVSAWLLQKQFPGHEIIGLFMRNWEEDDGAACCSAGQDLADVQQVCATLGIKVMTANLATEYRDQVFQGFIAGYRKGDTPNPDILCNERIKFRAFLDHAMGLGADYIATGHYASKAGTEQPYRLLKSVDAKKDQSYFLYRLDQQQLAHTLFPLGKLRKTAVRTLARQAGFANHAKKDSTGICFIGERPFREFLGRYIPSQPGKIHDLKGTVLGTHQGACYYTLGQRRGLGIGGHRDTTGEAWYVVGKDMGANRLYVVQGHDHPLLFCSRIEATECHWINHPPYLKQRYSARLRHGQTVQDCTVIHMEGGNIILAFDQAQRAVSPGQSVVLYADEQCLGGGIISGTDQPPLHEIVATGDVQLSQQAVPEGNQPVNIAANPNGTERTEQAGDLEPDTR